MSQSALESVASGHFTAFLDSLVESVFYQMLKLALM